MVLNRVVAVVVVWASEAAGHSLAAVVVVGEWE